MARQASALATALSFCAFVFCSFALVHLLSSPVVSEFIGRLQPRHDIVSLASIGTAEHAEPLRPDIRADTNRDGVVDITGTSDVSDKKVWTSKRGAIFLPNVGDKYRRCHTRDGLGNSLSNDELAACHDASGHLLLAPEYVAPLKTVPMNVSENAHAQIYATPRAAYDRVRLFVLDNPAKANETSSWRLVDRGFAFNATQLQSGITLGLDGRELVTDSSIWDGSVTIRFDVVDGMSFVWDEVALKMAPVLTHHHLQTVQTIITIAANDSEPARVSFVQQLDDARSGAGIQTPLVLLNQSDDIWAQDFLEPAYASMPGPNGPISLRVMLRSAQSTRTGGRQIFEQLRGPGVGGYQPSGGTGSGFGHREINSFGNLETIPPYTSRAGVQYKAGRIIMGKHFHEPPAQVMLDFLNAQGLQSPLILEAGWLLVGHVDEFVQFLPYNNDLGFTIAIADTEAGLQLLRRLEERGHGNVLAISYSDDEFHMPGMGMSITETLSNTTFLEANSYSQKHLDTNLQILLTEIPLDPEDVIRVPVLFKDAGFTLPPTTDGLPPRLSPMLEGERQVMAFNPAAINGVVIGTRYICPKPWGPVVNGADLLEKEIEKAYGRAGMSVTYVDDFLSHHVMGGEVHCGSNTLRDTDLVWWE
ncbi:hypothetical protein jhhlp_000662 [Lomentospora prolificans]|uniref:Protein-arginine deiminase C-terminal domain-containing protein n=1 Tax=Lomentospora prolificans TaxID=41688 RepID=A0A2N3NJ28_9PEZI|nr:hypothetical protein jhhlp_000662 [Lomentospora prolificans]